MLWAPEIIPRVKLTLELGFKDSSEKGLKTREIMPRALRDHVVDTEEVHRDIKEEFLELGFKYSSEKGFRV